MTKHTWILDDGRKVQVVGHVITIWSNANDFRPSCELNYFRSDRDAEMYARDRFSGGNPSQEEFEAEYYKKNTI